jgi:hypothetical protein
MLCFDQTEEQNTFIRLHVDFGNTVPGKNTHFNIKSSWPEE